MNNLVNRIITRSEELAYADALSNQSINSDRIDQFISDVIREKHSRKISHFDEEFCVYSAISLGENEIKYLRLYGIQCKRNATFNLNGVKAYDVSISEWSAA